MDDRCHLPTFKAAADSVAELNGGSLDVLINNGALLFHETGMKTFKDL